LHFSRETGGVEALNVRDKAAFEMLHSQTSAKLFGIAPRWPTTG